MNIVNVSVKRAYADGKHNAFTNIARFRDRYYLVFRSGSFHCSRDGHIIVISSEDLVTWAKVADLSQVDRDSRDAQLMVLEDRLVVVSYISDKRYGKIFDHQAVYSVTNDGKDWTEWTPFLEKHAHLWSIKKHEDCYYAGIFWNYPDPADWKAGLARSKDGFDWDTVSMICEQDMPDETAIDFLPDGTCLALVRRAWNTSLIATAPPPYKKWEIKDSGINFGGPAIANVQGRLLLGARFEVQTATIRKDVVTEENNTGVHVTAMFELSADGVKDPFILPSLSDTAYPGFVHLGGKWWAMSYYSSHEDEMGSDAPCNIYVATFEVDI